jgi:hypothetical protein
LILYRVPIHLKFRKGSFDLFPKFYGKKSGGHLKGKNQFMKKRFFVVVALLAGSVTFAQEKKTKQSPPPPPPKIVDVKEVHPPPPPPKAPPPPKVIREGFPSSNNADYQEFLKRNPTVKGIGWSEDKVRIHLKSGKQEVYNLKSKEDVLNLKNKYGELPEPPPPPPPPPPKLPRMISES